MDEVEFHREPPTDVPTMVTAFSGWIDAGEAATDAMRLLVRQLAAEPLATIDLEDFVDFTQERPVVSLTAAGERTIRWPRSAFWLWQPPEPRRGGAHEERQIDRIGRIHGIGDREQAGKATAAVADHHLYCG